MARRSPRRGLVREKERTIQSPRKNKRLSVFDSVGQRHTVDVESLEDYLDVGDVVLFKTRTANACCIRCWTGCATYDHAAVAIEAPCSFQDKEGRLLVRPGQIVLLQSDGTNGVHVLPPSLLVEEKVWCVAPRRNFTARWPKSRLLCGP